MKIKTQTRPEKNETRTGGENPNRIFFLTWTGPDRKKMKPGPEVKTRTDFFSNPDQTGPEKLKPGPEGTTWTGKNKTRTRTGLDRNIPGLYNTLFTVPPRGEWGYNFHKNIMERVTTLSTWVSSYGCKPAKNIMCKEYCGSYDQ